jgi:hypothetical protein
MKHKRMKNKELNYQYNLSPPAMMPSAAASSYPGYVQWVRFLAA